jgi:hypothetical protein
VSCPHKRQCCSKSKCIGGDIGDNYWISCNPGIWLVFYSQQENGKFSKAQNECPKQLKLKK